jgi:hypothetical protein
MIELSPWGEKGTWGAGAGLVLAAVTPTGAPTSVPV